MMKQTHSTSAAPSPVSAPAVRQLRTVFEGQVLAPNDAGYDEARTVFYGGIDRRPALIVSVKNATDVGATCALVAYKHTWQARHRGEARLRGRCRGRRARHRALPGTR